MRLRLSVVFMLLSHLPAAAEIEPQCRATSADGSPVVTMKKAGGKKPLAQVPSGTVVESDQIKDVGGARWLLIYPDSILSSSGGWVKASEVACEGKIETLWDYDAAEYADDGYQVAGHPLPIRFWVDARAELNGETWLRAMYFDDENTVGWVPDAAVVCD